ncbi:hypothetical protein SAMN05216421_1946 [Halopseudomonas xinjiangensis]|uniref:Uncharacterized protein n=1 Tax=Halopseudomonas xinjiangensis TaxID=487184 RepID=A0A1H1U313_9GAMM|nr:hypothetical protein [Halopseudomonas xinjiangensis]SDS66626.1 hypothetical protein SAMN05216421_1946 [Halopseudomonas xinjiangensis]
MSHRLFGLAMMGKGLFAGAALAIVLQGGQSVDAAPVAQEQTSVTIRTIHSINLQPAGLPASGVDGTLTPDQVANRHRQSWVF